MDFLTKFKNLGLLNIIVLAMLSMGYTVIEISERAKISRQTVYDIRNKAK